MFFKRTRISFEAGLIILSLLFQLYVIFSPADSLVNWYTSDDAYYYFQVARNVANGFGATFDGIDLTNGFHPLWMLVCIPVFSLAKLDLFLTNNPWRKKDISRISTLSKTPLSRAT